MNDQDSMMKISAFAAFTQRSPRALRHYEELGLISPLQRTEGGFRLYHAEQALRLEYIDNLQALGCSLSDIQQLIASWSSQPTAHQGMRALETAYQGKLIEVRSAIDKLRAVESELAESVEFLRGCRDCTNDTSPVEACAQCDRAEEHDSTLIKGISEPLIETSLSK